MKKTTWTITALPKIKTFAEKYEERIQLREEESENDTSRRQRSRAADK